MSSASPLAVSLANAALVEVDHPATAVAALMGAAAAILQRDFGEGEAVQLMVAMVNEAASEAVAWSGLVATKH